ncbi:AMP-binding protein [Bradyrhizobium ivorense]|uniref:AMP-binding protein n=1 Tax=Bradyrhizobium ivorense TaxID=2511166 RepID=UPI001E48EEEE|nr:AMP-binding protein [Bradyrhizobium ivorense]
MPRNAIRWGTHGRAVPGNEIRVVDPDSGTDMPAGAPGEIVIRGLGVFKGYRNRPDATAETLRNGWLHTGDIGCLDADGYLTFMGRFKETIKVSGYSVFPEEVAQQPGCHRPGGAGGPRVPGRRPRTIFGAHRAYRYYERNRNEISVLANVASGVDSTMSTTVIEPSRS